MSEHEERKDHGSPVVSEVCQSEWKPAGEIPWRVHPSLIPSFWMKGRGDISPNSPSPFLRPHTQKVSQQLSRTSGSQETHSPHGLRSLPQQVYEDAQGAKFPFTFEIEAV